MTEPVKKAIGLFIWIVLCGVAFSLVSEVGSQQQSPAYGFELQKNRELLRVFSIQPELTSILETQPEGQKLEALILSVRLTATDVARQRANLEIIGRHLPESASNSVALLPSRLLKLVDVETKKSIPLGPLARPLQPGYQIRLDAVSKSRIRGEIQLEGVPAGGLRWGIYSLKLKHVRDLGMLPRLSGGGGESAKRTFPTRKTPPLRFEGLRKSNFGIEPVFLSGTIRAEGERTHRALPRRTLEFPSDWEIPASLRQSHRPRGSLDPVVFRAVVRKTGKIDSFITRHHPFGTVANWDELLFVVGLGLEESYIEQVANNWEFEPATQAGEPIDIAVELALETFHRGPFDSCRLCSLR